MVIYVFSDEFGVPKYVGKAKDFNTRIKQHVNRDRLRYDTWFYRWLNKQIREDKEYHMDVLEECNETNWQQREQYWINHIRENEYELCNMTEGGDGNNNQYFSPQSLEKRAVKLRGRKRPQEVREKISAGHKGKVVKKETRQKLRDINLGKPCPEHVKKLFSKVLIQSTLDGVVIKEWNSLIEAAQNLGCRKGTLSNVLSRKKVPKYKGYLWQYKTT